MTLGLTLIKTYRPLLLIRNSKTTHRITHLNMSTMRAIAVETWGQDPTLINVPKPTEPTDDTQIQLKVVAAGLPNLVRSQASGKHYSSKSTALPYIPGSDGVGVNASGEFMYFSSLATGGSFAEYINIPKQSAFLIPFDEKMTNDEKNKTSISIASLANPAMASWLAMQTRTQNLRENFTVVINGVTSLSGKIAISHARALGAGKVIGLGRNEDALSRLGLDQYIVVKDPADQTDFVGQLQDQHIDVILDFVYGGGSTFQLLNALPSNSMLAHELGTQYVQIGSLGGMEMEVPSALLRSKNLTIRGSGPGAWSVTKDFKTTFPGLLQRLVDGVGEYPVVERRMEDVAEAWKDKKNRSVFVL